MASTDDYTTSPEYRPGQKVSLIRWDQVEGEWRYTTLTGQYRRRDSDNWHVTANGQSLTLDRRTWAFFA